MNECRHWIFAHRAKYTYINEHAHRRHQRRDRALKARGREREKSAHGDDRKKKAGSQSDKAKKEA